MGAIWGISRLFKGGSADHKANLLLGKSKDRLPDGYGEDTPGVDRPRVSIRNIRRPVNGTIMDVAQITRRRHRQVHAEQSEETSEEPSEEDPSEDPSDDDNPRRPVVNPDRDSEDDKSAESSGMVFFLICIVCGIFAWSSYQTKDPVHRYIPRVQPETKVCPEQDFERVTWPETGINKKITFECSPGYEGEMTRTCQRDGTWSHVHGATKLPDGTWLTPCKKNCPAEVTEEGFEWSETKSGWTAKHECVDNDSYEDGPTRECNDGVWGEVTG